MKILHVITSLRTGGAEKLMVDLLPKFRNSGHEVELCVFDGADTPFKQQLADAGISIISLGNKVNVYHPIYLWRLYKLLRNNKYDLIHTHNTAPQLFAAICSVLCSVVLCTTEHTTSNRRRGWKWYAAVDRWMYSRYKSVICISEKTEVNLKDFIGNSNTHLITIHNGIDVEKYRNSVSVDLKKNYPDCNTALVQVAGFRYQKDQDTVIRALNDLPDDIHLFLVGDGDRRSQLEKLTSSLGLEERVHFMGICTNVPAILKGSDIAVMSSHWEGFGLAAVEAMAAGIPVLASDVDGLAQVVDGAGLLFEHENHKQLAQKIALLIEDKNCYGLQVEKGYIRAQQFSIDSMTSKYLRQYEEINCDK